MNTIINQINEGRQMRTVTARNGRTAETPYTDHEAYAICDTMTKHNFAQSLTGKRIERLSEEQITWLHILAVEQGPEATALKSLKAGGAVPVEVGAAPINVGDAGKMFEMFFRAKDTLKFASIVLKTSAKQSIRFYLSGAEARHPGCIYVTNADGSGRQVYGYIDTEGVFTLNRKCSDEVRDLALQFAANPVEVTTAYGLTTGVCCFCNTDLTDERSTSVGYGPVCAKRWGLAWGKTKNEVKELLPA